MRKKDLIEENKILKGNVEQLQEQLRVSKRIIAELNLRLGNNQKISPEILESDLGRNLIVMKEELSFDQILITINEILNINKVSLSLKIITTLIIF